MPKSYPAQERERLIASALDQRYQAKKNWEEIADELDLARSTLTEWRKTEEWKEADQRWRRLMREQVRGDSAQMAGDANNVIYELAMTAKSEYVRLMAACKILDINQVGNEIEEAAADQQKELTDFLLKVGKRRLAASDFTVGAGGALPAALQAQNEDYRVRKIAETEIVEAEFREASERSQHEELGQRGEETLVD